MSSCQTGEVVMEQVSFLSFLCLRQYWGEIWSDLCIHCAGHCKTAATFRSAGMDKALLLLPRHTAENSHAVQHKTAFDSYASCPMHIPGVTTTASPPLSWPQPFHSQLWEMMDVVITWNLVSLTFPPSILYLGTKLVFSNECVTLCLFHLKVQKVMQRGWFKQASCCTGATEESVSLLFKAKKERKEN